jgi:hypothetical protein
VSRSSLKKNNDELAKALNKCKLLIGRPSFMLKFSMKDFTLVLVQTDRQKDIMPLSYFKSCELYDTDPYLSEIS